MSRAEIAQLRQLPSVDEVLRTQVAAGAVENFGRPAALAAVRETLAAARAAGTVLDVEDAAAVALSALAAQSVPSLRPVFNLTGTVLHTNLGRAPLPQEAVDAMVAVATGASNLEFDLATGKRGGVNPFLIGY